MDRWTDRQMDGQTDTLDTQANKKKTAYFLYVTQSLASKMPNIHGDKYNHFWPDKSSLMFKEFLHVPHKQTFDITQNKAELSYN